MKRTALVGLKVAVSLALLAYLFSVTDTHALEERVRSADLLLLVAAVACYLSMLALATWRWRLLLETLGVDAPMRRLLSVLSGGDVLQQLPPEQHRRRRGARARRLAPHRLDGRLARRGRHRPHPRASAPSTCSPRPLSCSEGPSSAGSRARASCSAAWRSSSWGSPTSSSGRARRARCSRRRGSTASPGRSGSSRRRRAPSGATGQKVAQRARRARARASPCRRSRSGTTCASRARSASRCR